MLFFLAALLPGLYWESGPETAPALKQAGIERLVVPEDKAAAWKAAGFSAEPAGRREKAMTPGVQMRMSEASATRVPWLDANGWRFLREAAGRYLYEVPPEKAGLAAAEAFVYGVDAAIKIAGGRTDEFAAMLRELKRLDGPALPPRANIGILDDGSAISGEVLNLLSRRNLLFRIVRTPDPSLDLNLTIDKAKAADPNEYAAEIRRKLGDEKRLLRIYGSEVVIGRLEGDAKRARVYLLNYSPRKVVGVRVRVLGEYPKSTGARTMDYQVAGGATELTLPEIQTVAVLDLWK